MLRNDDLGHLFQGQHEFFSSIATFISRMDMERMMESIAAMERAIAAPSFRQIVTPRFHPNAHFNPGIAGVFMGYDFHLHHQRPKLIEINTNAGGAFLNALLLSAQTACCSPLNRSFNAEKDTLYQQFAAMFLQEWRLQRGNQPLKRIAIVDSEPLEQFLYPEFRIAQRVFEAHGIEAVITAPDNLVYHDGRLEYAGRSIDLVYNRLTDFALADASSRALNEAYQAGAVVVTPNPHLHALYADKRNLILLSDAETLARLEISAADRNIILATVPRTFAVTAENAERLWRERKNWFFKPVAGYGGKAAYRGDKLTKRVWHEILQAHYVAQEQVAPSARGLILDEKPTSLKMDVRAYSYSGKVQLLAARLYQGQITNFRTSGGGFAPVFIQE